MANLILSVFDALLCKHYNAVTSENVYFGLQTRIQISLKLDKYICNIILSTENILSISTLCYCTTSEMPISQIKDVNLHLKQSFLQASDK